MAQRYGGKHSPGGAPRGDTPPPAAQTGTFDRARPDAAGARSNVFFAPPIVLAAMSLNDGATGMAMGFGGAAVLALSAWLLREGLRAEAAYNDRRVAKRPAMPRKIVSAGLTGLGVAIAALKNDPTILAAVIFGGLATGLQLAAFGLDPLRDKQIEGVDGFQQSRVARVVEEAESLLNEIALAGQRSGDREVEARLERFSGQVRDLMRSVEADPRDLTAARNYLGVYLRNIRDASVKFSDLYQRTRDTAARENFMLLLSDLETRFEDKTRRLLLEDGQDLSIEIDVLRKRMQREGVRLD